MTWHKSQAQPSQGVAGWPHHLGQPAMCWRISNNRFVYVSSRGGAQGIQCTKAVQGGNLAARPSCMARHLTSAPHAPNLQLEHHLTPPINTTVLLPVETVKKVKFSPPPPNSIFVEPRERWGFEGRRTFQLVGTPWSSSSAEALPKSI
jgi:hypothetical protein